VGRGDHGLPVGGADGHRTGLEHTENGSVTWHDADLAVDGARDDDLRLTRPDLPVCRYQFDVQFRQRDSSLVRLARNG
jgi:hypothetical protein